MTKSETPQKSTILIPMDVFDDNTEDNEIIFMGNVQRERNWAKLYLWICKKLQGDKQPIIQVKDVMNVLKRSNGTCWNLMNRWASINKLVKVGTKKPIYFVPVDDFYSEELIKKALALLKDSGEKNGND